MIANLSQSWPTTDPKRTGPSSQFHDHRGFVLLESLLRNSDPSRAHPENRADLGVVVLDKSGQIR
ncbi:hypothetical protein, partial [Dactylosporangium fulvum]|uniref:hypothetical protein n=1 Tax=Dactylosporangium fulvum TaxID=53359 RepID=UPI0031DB3B86